MSDVGVGHRVFVQLCPDRNLTRKNHCTVVFVVCVCASNTR